MRTQKKNLIYAAALIKSLIPILNPHSRLFFGSARLLTQQSTKGIKQRNIKFLLFYGKLEFRGYRKNYYQDKAETIKFGISKRENLKGH